MAEISRSTLLQALGAVDLYILAEAYGIDDEESAVNAALAHLRLEPSDRDDFGTIMLYYRSPELRPLIIDRKATVAEVHELVQEELNEWLADARGPGAGKVPAHLTCVEEIVDFELGFPQLKDMGLVLAYALARLIAEVGNGYVKDDAGVWWTIDNGAWKHIY